MKRKGIKLLAGILVLGCLTGVYFVLKTQNEKAEEQEAEQAAGEVIVEVDSTDIAAMSFLINGETVSFSRQEDGIWNLDTDETFPVDAAALLAPVSQLAPLHSVRTLTDPADLSEYGLDEPQNKIVLTDSEQNQTVLTIGSTNSSTGNDYLMMNDDETVIYTIESGLRTAFSTDLYDYAVSEEIPQLTAADITGVSVERSGGYRLYLEDAVWKVAEVQEDEVKAQNADADAVNDMLASLAGLSYTDYLEHNCVDAEPYGLETPHATVTISYKEETAASQADTEETETETEVTATEKAITFYIGDVDPSGNYYVQMKDSKEVHSMAADIIDTLLGTDAADWAAEEETEAESQTDNEGETESRTGSVHAPGTEEQSVSKE